MAIQPAPLKVYRLYDGSKGTEYEALIEVVTHKEAQKLRLEDEIAELRRRIETAEGHP